MRYTYSISDICKTKKINASLEDTKDSDSTTKCLAFGNSLPMPMPDVCSVSLVEI